MKLRKGNEYNVLAWKADRTKPFAEPWHPHPQLNNHPYTYIDRKELTIVDQGKYNTDSNSVDKILHDFLFLRVFSHLGFQRNAKSSDLQCFIRTFYFDKSSSVFTAIN